jgi:hypothetical protein
VSGLELVCGIDKCKMDHNDQVQLERSHTFARPLLRTLAAAEALLRISHVQNYGRLFLVREEIPGEPHQYHCLGVLVLIRFDPMMLSFCCIVPLEQPQYPGWPE